jgi:hypothetical protein
MRELYNYVYGRPQAIPIIIIGGLLLLWLAGQAFPFILEQLSILERRVVTPP